MVSLPSNETLRHYSSDRCMNGKSLVLWAACYSTDSSLCCREPLSFMLSHLSTVLFLWHWSAIQKVSPCWSRPPIFLSSSFQVWGLCSGPWSIWNWALCLARDKGPFSFFDILTPSFPSTICWRCGLFSKVYFWYIYRMSFLKRSVHNYAIYLEFFFLSDTSIRKPAAFLQYNGNCDLWPFLLPVLCQQDTWSTPATNLSQHLRMFAAHSRWPLLQHGLVLCIDC